MNRYFLLLSLALAPNAGAVGQELAVDHFWIRVSKGAPEAQAIADAGFLFQRFDQSSSAAPTDSSDSHVNQHTGQGTANMVVRFHNMYLELLWVEDRELLRRVRPNHRILDESPKASPFGIGLRHVGDDAASLPFESSSQWAPWMRPLVSLATATHDSSVPSEPTIFVIPRYMRWDLRVHNNPELLRAAQHEVDVVNVTRIRVYAPGLPSASQAVRVLEKQKLVEFVDSQNHLLEIEFDGRRESTVDFRPTLPLVIYH